MQLIYNINYVDWALEVIEQARDIGGPQVTDCAWSDVDIPLEQELAFIEALAQFGVTATPGQYDMDDMPCWRLSWSGGLK